jgi:hypothetical protein
MTLAAIFTVQVLATVMVGASAYRPRTKTMDCRALRATTAKFVSASKARQPMTGSGLFCIQYATIGISADNAAGF